MTAIATNEMDAVDQQLLNEMQDRFPLIREPFAALAERIGVTETDVITHIAGMRESGVLRQVSPELRGFFRAQVHLPHERRLTLGRQIMQQPLACERHFGRGGKLLFARRIHRG